MILITSAAYIDGEFAAEFGELPPVCLPLGNKRLLDHQIEWLRQTQEDIYLSLPVGFELDELYVKYLTLIDISIINVPLGLSLGESVIYCCNSLGVHLENIRILHGDTLVMDADANKMDYIAVSKNRGFYQRGAVYLNTLAEKAKTTTKNVGDDEVVLAGYFSFSSAKELIKEITRSRGDFVAGVSSYCDNHNIEFEKCDNWLDFGHINTYFRSRALMTTQRSFNNMIITTAKVTKSSKKKEKMYGEINWFQSLPGDMRLYAPHMLGSFENNDEVGYSLEYLYLLPLCDLFVFCAHPYQTWRIIFKACRNFLEDCRDYTVGNFADTKQFDDLYYPKTMTRLDEFSRKTKFDIERPITFNGTELPSLVEIAEITSRDITALHKNNITIIHGDFCLSNILYDFRKLGIKVIDPRGIDAANESTLYGDNRYDIAKLFHSVFGLYDFIIAGQYTLEIEKPYTVKFNIENKNNLAEIQKEFIRVFFHDNLYNIKEINAITIHLFLSMLPFHDEDPERQMALMANAIKMYLESC